MKSMSSIATLIGWRKGKAGADWDSVADIFVSYTRGSLQIHDEIDAGQAHILREGAGRV
jgi:hypothetical protein